MGLSHIFPWQASRWGLCSTHGIDLLYYLDAEPCGAQGEPENGPMWTSLEEPPGLMKRRMFVSFGLKVGHLLSEDIFLRRLELGDLSQSRGSDLELCRASDGLAGLEMA